MRIAAEVPRDRIAAKAWLCGGRSALVYLLPTSDFPFITKNTTNRTLKKR